jgi:hypothetical protein
MKVAPTIVPLLVIVLCAVELKHFRFCCPSLRGRHNLACQYHLLLTVFVFRFLSCRVRESSRSRYNLSS